MKNLNPKDFWDSLTTKQQEEIEQASQEVNEGKTIDYKVFISRHR